MIQPNRHFNLVWVMWWINEYCDCVLLANKRTNNRVSIGYLILLNSFSKNDFNLTNSWSSLGLGNYEVTSFELIILARPGNAPPWSRLTDFTELAKTRNIIVAVIDVLHSYFEVGVSNKNLHPLFTNSLDLKPSLDTY